MKKIIVFTDGGAHNNGEKKGIGGYGGILSFNESTLEVYGGVPSNATNNTMEITAVIKSLERITNKKYAVEIYSDSSYVVNCFKDKWYIKWRKNGWKTATTKKPIANLELWKQLIGLVEEFKSITFNHVKGHAGNDLNEACDGLATKGMHEAHEKNAEVHYVGGVRK